MKKLFYLLSFTLVFLFSCSKDDSNDTIATDPIKETLVKKVVFELYQAKEITTSTITYNGKKIVNITQTMNSLSPEKITFTYTGDLITKMVITDSKDAILSVKDYTYTNNKLTSFIEYQTAGTYKYKTKFIHNADNTIDYDEYRIKVDTGAEEEYGDTGTYTYKDGNLIKEINSNYGRETTTMLEYDTKNNPFKNITGINLLLGATDSNTVNNVVKEVEQNTNSTRTKIYTHLYNTDGFPTESSYTINGVSIGKYQYTY